MSSNVEKILRNIRTEEKILRSTKRVSVVKAVDCVMALSKKGFDAQTIKSEIQCLLNEYVLVRVKINEKDSKSVVPAMGKNVSATDYYMWVNDSYDYKTLAISILCVALVLCITMYRIWPPWLKIGARYAQYVGMGLIVFILVLAFVRLVVFGITYFTTPPGLWIFPNLFAECGFFESFVPLSSWGDEDVSHQKSS